MLNMSMVNLYNFNRHCTKNSPNIKHKLGKPVVLVETVLKIVEILTLTWQACTN